MAKRLRKFIPLAEWAAGSKSSKRGHDEGTWGREGGHIEKGSAAGVEEMAKFKSVCRWVVMVSTAMHPPATAGQALEKLPSRLSAITQPDVDKISHYMHEAQGA